MLIECNVFEGCDAPVCPRQKLDTSWFPDEDICLNQQHSKDMVIKNQKKIKKASLGKDVGYFTIPMLNVNCVIKKGILGLDPDKEEEPQLEAWFKKHPAIKEETRKIRQEQGKKQAERYSSKDGFRKA